MAEILVVTTNVGLVPEVVLDGLTGIITALDVEEIANTLEKLLNDRGLRARYGLVAQEFTLSHFGVKRLANDHEDFYKKLVFSRAKS